MKKNKFIPAKYERAKPPLLWSMTLPTLLHYWGAPQWAYGVIGCFLLLVWAAYVIWFINSEEMDWPPAK